WTSFASRYLPRLGEDKPSPLLWTISGSRSWHCSVGFWARTSHRPYYGRALPVDTSRDIAGLGEDKPPPSFGRRFSIPFLVERTTLMPTLYLTEDYTLVRRDSEDCLLVQIPEKRAKDGATPAPARKERIPLIKIDEVVVLGEVTLTASALHLLLERDVEITFLSHFGQFKGRLSPPFSKNAVLRLAQYRAHQDMAKRCELARRFVIGKLSNQRQRLQRFNRTHRDAEVSQVIQQLTEL